VRPRWRSGYERYPNHQGGEVFPLPIYVQLADAESQLAERRAVVESTWSSIQTLVENDFQLEYIRTSLQGYQLSVITLTGELNATKKEVSN
jgi:hypothetical protein